MTHEALKEFETLLKWHDWYYHFSDDGSAYQNGSNQAKKIKETMEALAAQGLEAEAQALYKTYCKG